MNIKPFGCAFMIALAVCAAGCGGRTAAEKSAERIEKSPVGEVAASDDLSYKQEVRKFKLEGFSASGENQWQVEGEFANIIDPDVILQSIKGASFSDKLSVQLTADEGVYNKDTRSAELKGNVIVTLADGGKVFMDSAQWNAGDEIITTVSDIRIEHSGITLTGTGALVKPQVEWAKVNTGIRLEDSAGRVITCDGPLEVDYRARKAIFNNNVEILEARGTMYADTVIAYFDPEKREVEKIEWLGNVRAVY